MHRQFYERRREWFEVLGEMHFVMWWVPAGHRPTLDEGLERLAQLRAHGNSERRLRLGVSQSGAALADEELRGAGGGIGKAMEAIETHVTHYGGPVGLVFRS